MSTTLPEGASEVFESLDLPCKRFPSWIALFSLFVVLLHSTAGGITWPTFKRDRGGPGDPEVEVDSILNGLRMREAYFNARRTRVRDGRMTGNWNDLLDKLGALFLWSDGGQVAKERSARILCAQLLSFCEAALGSMFSKASEDSVLCDAFDGVGCASS